MVISVKKAFFVMSGLALVLMVSVLLITMISSPVFVATSSPENVVANIIVPGVCEISLSSNRLSFGSILPNSNYSANVLVSDTNGGNTGAYINIYGSNWIDVSNSLIHFSVTNTIWNAIAQTSYTGTALTAVVANTQILVPGGSSANIYFGAAVPAGQTAGTYNQTITLLNSC